MHVNMSHTLIRAGACARVYRHTILQHHWSERNFYQRSFVFQVVISSHCCCSANQKSHTPMRVIISPSGEEKKRLGSGKMQRDVCISLCVCVRYDMICIMIEFSALSNKMGRLDLFQSFAYRRA